MKIAQVILIYIAIVLFCPYAYSQVPSTVNRSFVDEDGILRWSKNNQEIHGFGVNYTVPFAHAYRMAERMGLNPKEVIKQDIYHFARLDLDLYRVHVWDTEISDSIGNLIENDHLDVFDFMISEMKQRGMKFVITPIAFWGNGWPEPDEETPGFSNKYGKENCLTNPDAIKAQANYLNQLLNHVNPYTKTAYKDEADVIAFEISNEPHHNGSVKEVTQYINKLVKSMRKTGTQAPVFYNMSHSIHLVDAYLNANVQGGTFQWYPSGLVAKHALKGNFLPNVDNYDIPFADHPKFKSKAKIVYEFDPADVAGNYMYPAMARSFRNANMQLATHFAYDAMFLAPYNTNYGTHYMNLAYAPQKAISLKIASAVFHDIPMGSDFGTYPQNTKFAHFTINQENDLVELVSETRFFYSNSTKSRPSKLNGLQEICGYKSSPLVNYEGLGAYFLDEIEKGVWRLEVMPDAYWLEDPYEPTSPKRQVAAVNHSEHQMSIYLPQLGSDFYLESIVEGNQYNSQAVDHTFSITPGVYILKEKTKKYQVNPTATYKNIKLNEFVAPESNLDTVLVKENDVKCYSENKPVSIYFDLLAPEKPSGIKVALNGEFGFRLLSAKQVSAGRYELAFPVELTQAGRVNYYVNVEQKSGWRTFPSGLQGLWSDWDVYDKSSYTIDFVASNTSIMLWDAEADWNKGMIQWNKNIRLKPQPKSGKIGVFYDFTSENKIKKVSRNQAINTFKYYVGDKLKGRIDDLSTKNKLIVAAKSINDVHARIEISLIDKVGKVYSGMLELNSTDEEYEINLDELTNGKYAIIPRPFPDFLPFYYEDNTAGIFDLQQIESIQVSVYIGEKNVNGDVSFYLSSIRME
ncbi:hypothetical protein E9993_20060 [Labilibacter sediminis]|nr:hypothetical protein E9993_20060 [Labilibacter sediminis]